MKAWILAMRPKTLPAAAVPVWVGCVLAWKLTGEFSLMLALCTLFGAIFIQVATDLFNDAIDDRNWEGLDRVFTQDAVFDLTGVGSRVCDGLDDIKSFMESMAASHSAIRLTGSSRL